MDQDQRRTGAEKIGGSTLNFQSDGIYSPTKLTNKASWVQLFFTLNKHMITFSLFPFAFSPFSPLFSISPFPFLYFFPLFPSFLSEIYSPTPFTVRRQGGPLDPPEPPSRTPLIKITWLSRFFFRVVFSSYMYFFLHTCIYLDGITSCGWVVFCNALSSLKYLHTRSILREEGTKSVGDNTDVCF